MESLLSLIGVIALGLLFILVVTTAISGILAAIDIHKNTGNAIINSKLNALMDHLGVPEDE
ncbi:MAG TPA: hypothetical protein VMW24_27990 [Sedimentisphaerales bacterium]|nr:hypothetical protein [Sedimentisphaerales bacterium]